MTARSCLLAGLVALCIPSLALASPPMGLSAGGSGNGTGRLAVVMTAATLGDDCGGSAAGAGATPSKAKAKSEMSKSARRACEQSSMQLSVSGAESPATLQVKKV